MPPTGFEPIIPEIEQTHSLDGATAVCKVRYIINNVNISSVNVHIRILASWVADDRVQGRHVRR
jgi:hypothetical protein